MTLFCLAAYVNSKRLSGRSRSGGSRFGFGFGPPQSYPAPTPVMPSGGFSSSSLGPGYVAPKVKFLS